MTMGDNNLFLDTFLGIEGFQMLKVQVKVEQNNKTAGSRAQTGKLNVRNYSRQPNLSAPN